MTLEQQAIIAWRRWGSYWHLYTRCRGCNEVKVCRGPRRDAVLCLDCFDQRQS